MADLTHPPLVERLRAQAARGPLAIAYETGGMPTLIPGPHGG